MAWIESHQGIERHPKTLQLSALMGWDLDTTIGKLHRFWWWALEYSIDGDLRKFNDAVLAGSVGLASEHARQFIESMVESRWIDRGDGTFRIHDWWDYVGKFLQIKHKRSPECWQRVREAYVGTPVGDVNGDCNGAKHPIPDRPNLTNQTKPNQTDLPDDGVNRLADAAGISMNVGPKERNKLRSLIALDGFEAGKEALLYAIHEKGKGPPRCIDYAIGVVRGKIADRSQTSAPTPPKRSTGPRKRAFVDD